MGPLSEGEGGLRQDCGQLGPDSVEWGNKNLSTDVDIKGFGSRMHPIRWRLEGAAFGQDTCPKKEENVLCLFWPISWKRFKAHLWVSHCIWRITAQLNSNVCWEKRLRKINSLYNHSKKGKRPLLCVWIWENDAMNYGRPQILYHYLKSWLWRILIMGKC